MAESTNPDRFLETAVSALNDGSDFQATLDRLPVPIYVTDAAGMVTYWNQACIGFAGRQPELGTDRWCVTWQLFTTAGDPMPHDKCPMAMALRSGEPVHDAIAIAQRPDGSRVAFRPYPTPLRDSSGALRGAVNMLIDVTREQRRALGEQADRCRRLAGATYDRSTSAILETMADEFERTASQLVEHA